MGYTRNRFALIAMLGAAFALPGAAESKAEADKRDREEHGDHDKGSARFLEDRDECRDQFADVAEKVIPSVVSIYADREDLGPARRREHGLGSGVIVGPKGLILTNNHVIADATSLRVRLSDGREFDAKLVAADKASDVAVIRLQDASGPLPALPLGDSDKLRVGSWVVAVGSPYGLSETVTTGIVSAKGRKGGGGDAYGSYIQTDAAINPGNSGGALVNMRGELIGINTAIVSRSGGYQGIGLAIPSKIAEKAMRELVKDGSVTRGWLGITIQTLTADLADAMDLKTRKGALVTSVAKGGPGEAAGVKRGDVILRLDDAEIADAGDLLTRAAEVKPGKEADLTLQRGIKTLEVTVKMGKRREPDARRWDEDGLDEGVAGGKSGNGGKLGEGGKAAKDRIGLRVTEPDKGLRRRYHIEAGEGVVVLAVERGSLGREAGLEEGDFIVEANGRSLRSPQDLKEETAKAKRKADGRLLLLVKRGEEVFYASILFNAGRS